MAFTKQMTICELIANAILKAASDLLKFGMLTLDVGSKELVKDFDSLLQGDIANTLRKIMAINNAKLNLGCSDICKMKQFREMQNAQVEVIKVKNGGKEKKVIVDHE